VLGYTAGYKTDAFQKEGAGTMTAARPAPLFDWFIPIDGDGVHLGTLTAERPPTFAYLREVVQTAERLGFHSLLIPTRFVNGLFDEGAPLVETWTMATALAAVTSRIRFLIAIRPGFIAAGSVRVGLTSTLCPVASRVTSSASE
jgi:alkanesulfonate monooxygenase